MVVDGVSDAMVGTLTQVLDTAKAELRAEYDEEAVVAYLTAALTSARGGGEPALTDEEIVREILQAQTSAPLTRDLSTQAAVTVVMAAYTAALDGDPVGTLLVDPTSGDVAFRVNDGGVAKWQITDTLGQIRFDARPTLPGWTAPGAP